MPILVVIIFISFAFYLFYKIKSFRTHRPMEKKWLSGKSSIALGLFVFVFGVNQLFLYPTTTTYIVAALFILIGGFSIFGGYKMYKHYLPFAIKEAQESKQV